MPNVETRVIAFTDVKLDHLAMLDGTLDVSVNAQPNMRGQLARWQRNPLHVDAWEGGSAEQTRAWICDGYAAKGAPPVHVVAAAPRKRTRWQEEGDDLDISRAWSGDPTPFSRREAGVKAGITIVARMGFSASTPAQILSDYGQWLGQLTSGYMAAGHDIELSAEFAWEGLYTRGPKHVIHRLMLKKFGQQSDYASWSALFSPTGFRHLVFSMWAIDAARHGNITHETLGWAIDIKGKWSVTFDKLTNTMTIDRPYVGTKFDADAMTRAAHAAFMP